MPKSRTLPFFLRTLVLIILATCPGQAQSTTTGDGAGQGETQAQVKPQVIVQTETYASNSNSTRFVPPADFLRLHRDGDRLAIEIPRHTLNTDLFVTCDAEPTGVSHKPSSRWRSSQWGWCSQTLIGGYETGGNVASIAPTFIWRLTQEGDSVLVQAGLEVRVPVLRYGTDSAPIIDVSVLFRSGWGTVPAVTRAALLPTRVEVDVSQSVGSGGPPLVLHWRMGPMPYRPFPLGRVNANIPLLTTGTSDANCVIRRLLKRDPWAESSDVVNPIVYYISRSVSKQWLPYVKRGVESWNVAFDAIGFRHAIVAYAEDEPIPDAMAHLHNARDVIKGVGGGSASSLGSSGSPLGSIERAIPWSVASLVVNDTEVPRTRLGYGTGNATHPVCDQRGGNEGASIDIDGVDYSLQNIFFLEGAADPAMMHGARAGLPVQCPMAQVGTYCPVPDSLLGLHIALVVAHEMGHSLGLNHNWTSRWTYPTDSLRSRTFLERMGLTPTVMDYALFNYIAQPSDKLSERDLVKQIGSYDKWAISYLYRPIPGAYTLKEEEPTLAKWRAVQDTAPYLRGANEDTSGSSSTTFDKYLIGDDLVKGADYHIKNLGRLAATFDLSREDVLSEWVRALKMATAPVSNTDSAMTVSTVHFYLEHVVLGYDSLLQAAHITWDSAPLGWNLSRWQRRQTTLVSSIVQLLHTLLPPDPWRATWARDMRQGVCREITTAVKELSKKEAKESSASVKAHTDSVLAQLSTIAAPCPK